MDLKQFSWNRWLPGKVALAAIFVLSVHLIQGVEPPPPDDPRAEPLARHLTNIGAKFYGASWCEHCQRQKKYFGSAADLLPFVECKPGSPSAPTTTVCLDNGITSFPTWIIKDKRYQDVFTLSDLAELSGFTQPPPQQKPASN